VPPHSARHLAHFLGKRKALAHALASPFRNSADASQRQTETSLIERFLYPKFGPGQMWEEVARRVSARGGQIHLRHRIVGVERTASTSRRSAYWTNRQERCNGFRCDYFYFDDAVHDLIALLQPEDSQIRRIADRLPYRDFMTAGLLLRRMNSSSPGRRNADGPMVCRRTIGSTSRSRT